MVVNRDWMTQVRAVVDDITQRHEPPKPAENEAWRAFHYHQARSYVPALDPSPRARMERAVNWVAARFAWGPETVAHFLDTRGVAYLSDLSMPQLEDLLERMQAYEDAAAHGHSTLDDPAAF